MLSKEYLLVITSLTTAFTTNAFQQWQPPSDLSKLKFVAVVTRHGSRAPLSTYPTDPYPVTEKQFWPSGNGQLTRLGKRQMYEEGKRFRREYDGFLPRIYDTDLVLSTYNLNDRDYDSGALFMAGLFPPFGSDRWNPSLRWNPNPLYPRYFDICVIRDKCPAYKKEADKLISEIDKDSTNAQNEEKLQDISEKTGSNVTKVSQLYDFYDTILCQIVEGYEQPSWSKDYFESYLRPSATKTMWTSYAGSEKIIKLGAGPELKYIVDLMNKTATGNSKTKFFVEAAHDCTLIALLAALGEDDMMEIEFAAHIVFELYEVPPSYFVKVMYYSDCCNSVPRIIKIKGCSEVCSLETFAQLVASLAPSPSEACPLDYDF